MRKVVRFLYGYPVYDLDYRKNVTAMREAVAATGLRLLGRFAQFDYINSDECLRRAKALAERLNAALPAERGEVRLEVGQAGR